ncbi:MAG: signal recognition particle subunit SRP19/SEC65 family protein [Candidatus Thermoplasmatota archaeon]
MVSRNENAYAIWPEYFDANFTRKKGRRVAKNFCIASPTIDKLIQTAKKLNIFIRAEECAYPSRWWAKSGRLLVQRKYKKTKTCRLIGEALREQYG